LHTIEGIVIDGAVVSYQADDSRAFPKPVDCPPKIRLPIGGSRIVPYGAAGLGIVRSSATTIQLYSITQTGSSIYLGAQNVAPNTSFAVNFGGGLRFFITERIGIRLEFKAFVPTSAPTGVSNDLFHRFAIGPVFQVK
jgi:hypothetical protein